MRERHFVIFLGVANIYLSIYLDTYIHTYMHIYIMKEDMNMKKIDGLCLRESIHAARGLG